jgi:hypothetical protein
LNIDILNTGASAANAALLTQNAISFAAAHSARKITPISPAPLLMMR